MKAIISKPQSQSTRDFKIFVPKDFDRSEWDWKSEITTDLLRDSFSKVMTAAYLGITVLKLEIQIEDGSNFPPHFMLRGSKVRHFPRTWLEAWMKSRTLIHKI
jgi:hypothetical protein